MPDSYACRCAYECVMVFFDSNSELLSICCGEFFPVVVMVGSSGNYGAKLARTETIC